MKIFKQILLIFCNRVNIILGYRGKNCRIDINECAGVSCLNGGSCVDMVNNFTCECQSGYSGVM